MYATPSYPRTLAHTLGLRAACVAAAIAASATCALRTPEPPSPPTELPLVEVTLDMSREWTDAGLTVRNGDRLVFWATGEMRARSKAGQTAGPDGIKPSAYRVGKGGLVGRVAQGKPFDVGARTHLIWKGAYRSHRLVTPPPLEMKGDGPLRLGVRDWAPGRYEGTYQISIWRAPAALPPSASREASMPTRRTP